MYIMYVLFDAHGKQKPKSYSCKKVLMQLMWCISIFFNVTSGNNAVYFSKCVAIKDSIAPVTVAITVVSLELWPLDRLAPRTN